MTFRWLQIDPTVPSTTAPVNSNLPEKLPKVVTYALSSEAAQAYKSVYDGKDCPGEKPWLRPADARRLLKRTVTQFEKDWPQIRLLLSDVEGERTLQAYRHVQGCLQAWEHIDSLDLDTAGGSGNILEQARTLRDDLLALAQVVYRGNEALENEIDRIRAMSQPNNSLYDEFYEDLNATVSLFETNKFQKEKGIEYPKAMLVEATKLAPELPLFRPASNAQTPSDAQPSDAPPPLLYRSFTVFSHCYTQLLSGGHLLHFSNRNVGHLYPRLGSSLRPSNNRQTEEEAPAATASVAPTNGSNPTSNGAAAS